MSSSPGRRPYLHAPAPSSVAVFEPDVDPVSSAEISSARPLDDAPRITTLGRFGVTLPNVTGDQPPVLLRGQAQHLLKCLLAAPSYQRSSDQLADLLWPQLSPEASQAALRQTLSRLRRTLEPQAAPYGRARYITREDGVVSLRLASDDTDASALWVDRYHFERLATTAIAGLTPQAVPERALQAQQMGDAALALYRGEFLAFDLYADWTRTVRDRCRRLWTQLPRTAERGCDR